LWPRQKPSTHPKTAGIAAGIADDVGIPTQTAAALKEFCAAT
jgi:hypothetical protein